MGRREADCGKVGYYILRLGLCRGGSELVKAVYLEGPRRPDPGCIGSGDIEELGGKFRGSQYGGRCLDSDWRGDGVELVVRSPRGTCSCFVMLVSSFAES